MYLSFFSNYLRPYKPQFALVLVLMVFESIVSLAIPFFIGQFASSVLQEPSPGSFASSFGVDFSSIDYSVIVGIWLALIVLQSLARFQIGFRVNMVGARILTNLSCRLYDHVQMLPMDYFSKRKKGEILSLISNDANVIAYFLSGVLTGLVPSLLIAGGAIVLMANINWQLALIIVLSVPAFFVLLKFLGRKIRPLSEQITQQQAGIVSIAAENFSTIKLLKSFSKEQSESRKFKQNAHDMLALRKSQFRIQALISPLIQMLISIGIVLVVLVSALSYRSGDLSISQLITLLMYGLLFAKPMSNLANMYGQVQQAMGASNRIIDVFKVSPEADDSGKDVLEYKHGHIQLEQVSFAYDDANTACEGRVLLKDASAQFLPKSVNIIVGANGSGKTTLMHLLMRFIEPKSGAIYIDGQDISQCTLRSLRKQIGLVSQDVALSHGSIFDNIAYGQPDISSEQVEAAAKAAGAHAFIQSLENGYDTHVGDNGVLLSGGQRQRISLARTLLLDCKIIIFDEPTSFADSLGKQSFADLLMNELKEHTVIVVTHDDDLKQLVIEQSGDNASLNAIKHKAKGSVFALSEQSLKLIQ
ncbi:ABC transporter ATP-binding protein [Ningiella sp. W23]|uniref:ABC transporter ATP-binding protein n=1 Tax=Ningiella sp. W23 TaxID=3023715 RepID=UPI003756974E